jgi:hypothetical protein
VTICVEYRDEEKNSQSLHASPPEAFN